MLSIALVLILMVGVNYVFKTATNAVGAGQTANTMSRDSQSAQALLFSDFQNINKNPPCFIIASQMVDQFLNSADAQTGNDPSQVVDITGNTTQNPTGYVPVTPGIYNYRCHRVDLLKFFVRGNYRRRSGDDGTFVSSTTSNDAFITLGHALLPNNDAAAYLGPVTDLTNFPNHVDQFAANSNGPAGLWQPQNDNNNPQQQPAAAQQRLGAYATDWVLARSVMLLKDPTTNYTYGTKAAPTVNPTNFTEHNYPRYPYVDPTNYPNTITFAAMTTNYLTNAPAFDYPYLANMTPLAYYTPDDQNQNGNTKSTFTTVMQTSRYDLACVTPDQFSRAIADELLQWQAGTAVNPNGAFTGGHIWWNPLVYSLAVSEQNASGAYGPAPYSVNATGANSHLNPNPYYLDNANQNPAPPQYQFGTYSGGAGTFAPYDYSGTPVPPELARVAVNPQIQTPMTSASIAQMAPYLIQHCSQFIVEYAGDYLQQDGPTSATPGTLTGQITGIGADGQIDYVIVTDPTTGNRYKKIRWYGMPRSTSGGTPNVWHGDPNNLLSVPYTIRGYNPGTNYGNADTSDESFTDPTTGIRHGIMEEFVDVIPLRDYYSLYYNTTLTATGTPNAGKIANPPYDYQPPWEVDLNFDPTLDYAPNPVSGVPAPYLIGTLKTGLNNWFHLYNPATANDKPTLSARYVAAWYKDMPAMIRILIKVDDPNDKLKDGPWYEYVFKLK